MRKKQEEWVRPIQYINGKLKVEIPEGVMWNQCPTCGELFESVYAFDCHRTGSFKLKTRRCMTIEEMGEDGMEKNRYNRWVSGSMSKSYADTLS